MQKKEKFFNLLKATRIKRTFPLLVLILIPAAYTNKFPLELLILGLVIIAIYSASSIYNAYKDKDYILPSYSKIIIFFLVVLALILASTNKIILSISLLAILLGYFYNNFARFIILGDAFFAGFTHFVLPFITSALLVGLETQKIIYSSIILYFIAFCIGPLTNLKDIKEDQKRKYKTLVNTIKKPYSVSAFLFGLSFILIAIFYLYLGIMEFRLLFLFPILILNLSIVNNILKRKEKQALNIMRFYLIISYFFLIINLTSNMKIILTSLAILLFYFLIIIFNKNGKI